MNEKFIKIPADFKSLHDLEELVSNYDFLSRLNNALNGYQRHYINSYLMSLNEVLSYIPENQHDLYKVRRRDDSIQSYEGDIGETGYIKRKIPLDIILKETSPGKEKIFLVNTVNKIIDVCYWAGKDSKKWRKGRAPYNTPLSYVDYTGKIEFVLESKTKNLQVLVHYSYLEDQIIGGVWINGRKNGYLSGGSRIPYTINGYDIYKFCTKTNKYLGYSGNKQDPDRPWQEFKGRW